VYKLIEFVKN